MESPQLPDLQSNDHDKRVSQEVSSLSTKLIEAIDKQSSLETSNQILKRQNLSLFQQLQELTDTKELYEKTVLENEGMKLELEKNLKLKNNAEQEVSKLRVEIEDLSESLFDEANNMVKDARIEAENFKIRNSKLSDTLLEKNITIESLTNELKILKQLLYELDSEDKQDKRKSIVATPNLSTDSLISENNEEASSVSQRDPTTLQSQSTMFASSKLNSYDKQLIYTPIYNSLRFDLANFQDFVRFVKFLYSRNSHSTVFIPVDFSVLKETAFFKKLFKEEIEPALAIDMAPDISYFNRKNFISALVEGRVIIEPISGVNESFKLNHKKTTAAAIEGENLSEKEKMFSYPKNSPPVATLSPCSICGEARNDILEHSRLYTLKLYSKKNTNITQHKYDPPSSPTPVTTLLPNESPASVRATLEITHQYSLCNYCLIKIRHICELFAFIRNINNAPKTKVWNFESGTQPKEELDLECIKAWFQMTKIRAKIFWSRVGIWDINEYSTTAASVPSTPQLKHQESDLGFRGSVIGTGIVAGYRQSFMDSINLGGGTAVNQGRRPDLISSLKNSPIVRSPLVNQVKGYFDDEEAAATNDDIINSHLESDSESITANSSTIVKNTNVEGQDLEKEDNNSEYESGDILDDYGDAEEDDKKDADIVEIPEVKILAAELEDNVPVTDSEQVPPETVEVNEDETDEVEKTSQDIASLNGSEKVPPETYETQEETPLKTPEIDSDEDDDSGEFNDASEHLVGQ